MSIPIVATKAYSSIKVETAYDYNVNTAYFDGIQLFKEQFGSSYTYDDDGNVISVKDLQGKNTTYEYTSNDLTKEILPTGAELNYTYDSYHNVKTATTEEGDLYSFTYDTYGNNTAVTITSGDVSMTSTATYAASGNYLASTTDTAGNTTIYNYNINTGILNYVKHPNDGTGVATAYTYDDMYRMSQAAKPLDSPYHSTAGTEYWQYARYAYDAYDRLESITTAGATYNFTYGEFGLRTGVSVGAQSLATYKYTTDGNNYLSAIDYGNTDKVEYTYDTEGRVTAETYIDKADPVEGSDEVIVDSKTVAYRYNNDGNLAKVEDSAIGRMYQYTYDLTDRLTKYEESGENYSFSMTYTYDSNNRLTGGAEFVNEKGRSVFYTYDGDNRLASYQKGWMKQNYTYDAFGRNSKKVLKDQKDGSTVLTANYTFRTAANGNATGQVSQMSIDSDNYDVAYSYTYDNNGNILSVSDGTYTTTYQYDEANQLVRENNQKEGYTYTWVYGQSGNIENRREYDYTTAEIVISENPGVLYNYKYENTAWGDQLTAINSTVFTYDDIGNVLTDGKRTYTWQYGRQLKALTQNGATWTNTYNADGLRVGRTDGTNAYQYYYCDGDLVCMFYNGIKMSFSYTPDGLPYGIVYDGTQHLYITNLQGDVTAIIKQDGTLLVEYAYDAWGNVLSVTAADGYQALADSNPLRYRGYVLDRETQLYYLQSRYYDPELGRFINADGFVSTGQGILGNNMYTYCGNNPVNRKDPGGQFWKEVGNFFTNVGKGIASAFILAIAVPSASCALIMGKDMHYSRNDNNTVNIETIDQVPSDWTTSNTSKYPNRESGALANAHQNTAPSKDKPNTKFSSPDKHEEVIFSYDEVLITDPVDIGTYNYGTSDIEHWYYDVVPWLWWGNAENDPSTVWDRANVFVWGAR